LLVGVKRRSLIDSKHRVAWSIADSLAELARLADTAGLQVVGHVVQRLNRPNPATFIGVGKVAEVVEQIETTAADVVIFDDELSPRHQRGLEEAFGEDVKLLDRTALILDIFAQHARTREGAVQVELAQYEYRLPRLTRAWTHLARQSGGRAGGATGGVGVRGPGETQLETDRRAISRRIKRLKMELEDIRAHRARYRAQRRKSGIPTVAIVGYTNAGKSTLLNFLSGANVLTADQLFATLDPTTRRVSLPGGAQALFTDTVGFVQKLPTQLVAAFRATLEEVTQADLLIHVVDGTHPQVGAQVAAVFETLEDIGAGGAPVVMALNKIDQILEPGVLKTLLEEFPGSIAISALTGDGIDDLLAHVAQSVEEQMEWLDVVVPYDRGELVSLFHQSGLVRSEEHTGTGTHITGRMPRDLAGQFALVMAPQEDLDD